VTAVKCCIRVYEAEGGAKECWRWECAEGSRDVRCWLAGVWSEVVASAVCEPGRGAWSLVYRHASALLYVVYCAFTVSDTLSVSLLSHIIQIHGVVRA
jgi:hypothetical protein